MDGFVLAEIGKGFFSSERSVVVRGHNRRYSLIVDESSVVCDRLRVQILRETGGMTLVGLPRETLTGCVEVWVSRDHVQRECLDDDPE